MPYPLSTRRGNQGLAEPIPRKSLPRWPCLLPNIVVGVAPLRNLTGEADRQGLVEGFTDRLVIDLFRLCRALSFAWVADERRYADNLPPRNPPELSYVVYGSVQRGSYGTLRVNRDNTAHLSSASRAAPARGEPLRLSDWVRARASTSVSPAPRRRATRAMSKRLPVLL